MAESGMMSSAPKQPAMPPRPLPGAPQGGPKQGLGGQQPGASRPLPQSPQNVLGSPALASPTHQHAAADPTLLSGEDSPFDDSPFAAIEAPTPAQPQQQQQPQQQSRPLPSRPLPKGPGAVPGTASVTTLGPLGGVAKAPPAALRPYPQQTQQQQPAAAGWTPEAPTHLQSPPVHVPSGDPKRASVKLPMLPGRPQVMPIAVAQQQQQALASDAAHNSSSQSHPHTPDTLPDSHSQPQRAPSAGLKRPLPGMPQSAPRQVATPETPSVEGAHPTASRTAPQAAQAPPLQRAATNEQQQVASQPKIPPAVPKRAPSAGIMKVGLPGMFSGVPAVPPNAAPAGIAGSTSSAPAQALPAAPTATQAGFHPTHSTSPPDGHSPTQPQYHQQMQLDPAPQPAYSSSASQESEYGHPQLSLRTSAVMAPVNASSPQTQRANKRMTVALDFKPISRGFPVPPPRKNSTELRAPRIRTPSESASSIPAVPPSLKERDPSLEEFMRSPPPPVESIPESQLLKPIIPTALMLRSSSSDSVRDTYARETLSDDGLLASESSDGSRLSPRNMISDSLSDSEMAYSPGNQSILANVGYQSDSLIASDEFRSTDIDVFSDPQLQQQDTVSLQPEHQQYQQHSLTMHTEAPVQPYGTTTASDPEMMYAQIQMMQGSADGEIPPMNLAPLPDSWHPRTPAPVFTESQQANSVSSPLQTPVISSPPTPTTPMSPLTPSDDAETAEKKKKFGFKFGFGSGKEKDKAPQASAADADDKKKTGIMKASFKGLFGKKKGDAESPEPKSASTPEESSPVAHLYENYNKLIDAMSRDDLTFSFWMSQVIKRADVDKQARAWSKIFRYKNKIMELLGVLIQYEIDSTADEGTLFRNNNFTIGLLSQFTQDIARPYLKQVLCPLVEYIQTCGLDFEIQPDKLSPGADLDKNTVNVYELASKFLQAVTGSLDAIPKEIRVVCATLQHYVRAKFPNAVHTVVGGYFFLRLICPAIVSPEGFGVWPESSPLSIEQRRPLVLVSKTMQSLANEMYFSEEYMACLNSFITENVVVLQNFFDRLAFYDDALANAPPSFSFDAPDDESLMRFHQIIHKHWSPELKPLLATKGVTAEALGYDGISELEAILEQLGEPVDPKVLREARKAKEAAAAAGSVSSSIGKEKKDKKK